MVPSADGTMSWRELLDDARAQLGAAGLPNPSLEAKWLVQEASGVEGSEYPSGLDRLCTVRGVAAFDALMARRLAGEPIQYVLGHWSFRSLDLMIDRRVLIPRPETESLVSVALDELARQRDGRPLVAADLGTGSGAVALSLAVEAEDVHVVAVEASVDALAVARANLVGVGTPAARVQLVHGSWFEPLAGNEGRFNVVASNPPYVAIDEELPVSVRAWEPTEALLAGPDGLDAARDILTEVPRWLAPGGAVVIELGADQLQAASGLAVDAGLTDVAVFDDLAGLPRVLRARKP
jgi:release factor glutamine methyltransferase